MNGSVLHRWLNMKRIGFGFPGRFDSDLLSVTSNFGQIDYKTYYLLPRIIFYQTKLSSSSESTFGKANIIYKYKYIYNKHIHKYEYYSKFIFPNNKFN